MTPLTKADLAAFWVKVQRSPGGCWLWLGAKDARGYGRLWVGARGARRSRLAHRVAFAIRHGVDALPERDPVLGAEAMTVDHSCGNPRCVNADHLRLLTVTENNRNSKSATKTACGEGHRFDAANTYIDRRGRRSCKRCRRVAHQRWAARAA